MNRNKTELSIITDNTGQCFNFKLFPRLLCYTNLLKKKNAH